MSVQLVVVRDVTPEECAWLRETVCAGEVVYRCGLPTYGCISPTGVAVTRSPGEYPFFELPLDSVEPSC